MLTRGIVIKKVDSGENNQLITLYTKDFGKLTAVAKSIKKPASKQACHLDTLNLVDFLLVSGKNYPIITSAQSLKTFPGIKASLSKSAVGSFVLEAFNNLIYDNDKDPKLWDFISGLLEQLEGSDMPFAELQNFFVNTEKELVYLLGYSGKTESKDLNYFLTFLSARKFFSPELISQVSYIAELE